MIDMREAMTIIRREIKPLIKLVPDADTGEKTWTLWRAPWTQAGPLDERFAESPEVNVNALSATEGIPWQDDFFCGQTVALERVSGADQRFIRISSSHPIAL